MNSLNTQKVSAIAALAHIEISDENIGVVTASLEDILKFVDQLQAVDTTDVIPTSQVTGLIDVLREDVVKASEISPASLIALVPQTQDGQIKVKRVIK